MDEKLLLVKEYYILPETAELARDKGFDVICKCGYTPNHVFYEEVTSKNSHNIILSAPTQTILQSWIRVMHNIEVIPQFSIIKNFQYVYNYYILNKKDGSEYWSSQKNNSNEVFSYKTYEEALEEGLYVALKLIEI